MPSDFMVGRIYTAAAAFLSVSLQAIIRASIAIKWDVLKVVSMHDMLTLHIFVYRVFALLHGFPFPRRLNRQRKSSFFRNGVGFTPSSSGLCVSVKKIKLCIFVSFLWCCCHTLFCAPINNWIIVVFSIFSARSHWILLLASPPVVWTLADRSCPRPLPTYKHRSSRGGGASSVTTRVHVYAYRSPRMDGYAQIEYTLKQSCLRKCCRWCTDACLATGNMYDMVGLRNVRQSSLARSKKFQ